eukprot:TRINITY_DN75389_c0_g1_i1.p1 TRINITY_DN75389_c0_g1~~TRINITY_DN75389_c0_g1_i1.p1  ORF type:complete len:266 (-),score=119.09 TRINITY_DN75389_c0_g1_i1:90-887(-)
MLLLFLSLSLLTMTAAESPPAPVDTTSLQPHHYDTVSGLMSKAAMSGVLWTVGDLVAQKVEQGLPFMEVRFSLTRTLRLVVYAVFVFTPLVSGWYALLAYWFPGTSITAVLERTLLDQTVFATFILSMLFFCIALLEGRTVNEAVRRIKTNLSDTLRVNWMIWPVVQIVNFSFVPVDSQLLVVNIVNIPWTAYLAMRANGSSSYNSADFHQLDPDDDFIGDADVAGDDDDDSLLRSSWDARQDRLDAHITSTTIDDDDDQLEDLP